MPTQSKIRAVALLIYFATLLAIQHWFVHTGLSPDEHAIWLYGGIASLLFGSRLLNPYFTAPADAATNGFVALIALLPAFPLIVAWTVDAYVIGAAVAFCGGVSLASILVIIFRKPPGSEQLLIVHAIDRAVKGLGRPEIVFTVPIIAAVWLFHRDKPIEVFAILTTLAAIVIIRPLEATGAFIGWLWNLPKTPIPAEVVGVIAAHQSPGIVLIRQEKADQVQLGTPLVIADVQSPPLLGVALNYVGRDEGNLLRALTAPLPEGLARRAVLPSVTERGIAVSIALEEGEENGIQALVWISRLCGIVDADTTLEYMQFEVINEVGLEEGSLVEVRIGDERRVIYQVIEGLTREEVVQQKNKYGYARGKARKIGAWDEEHGKFMPVSWLPRMNAPIFLMKVEQHQPHAKCIGHFPSTPFGIGLDVSSCVTHNTAVLGILGVGKSYLSIELVERMIAQGVKVICLDLTNQYEDALSDFLDPAYQEAQKADLIKAGAGGKAVKNRELGGSRNNFKKAVYAQIKEFMAEGDDHFLRVVNPAQFIVTKQISYLDKNGEAELAWLTACEITSIFSDCA